VTDPPYGLSFMGKKWDYDVPSVEVWAECLRVLKPGGHLLAFAGTRTQHRMAVRIEDAGFEIRDMIAWVYGSGFPKSHDVSKAIDRAAGELKPEGKGFTVAGYSHAPDKLLHTAPSRGYVPPAPATDAARQWSGWGTALKPALEPITVARKPLGEKTVAANVLAHGTGGINVDGCRIKALTGQRPESTLNAWEQEKNLCNLCAKLVEKPAKPRTPAIKDISVGSHVGQTTSVKAESIRVNTVKETIGCFAGLLPEELANNQTDGFSLNTGACGRMPMEQFQQVTKSTTSTETGLTTGLRTCNACGCSITDLCTNGSMLASKSETLNMLAEQKNVALTGRWPSNLIHDGSEEVVGLFPQTGASKSTPRNNGEFKSVAKGRDLPHVTHGHDDSGGSAARFFYCAKASKKDRDEGCEGFEAKPANNSYGDGLNTATKIRTDKQAEIGVSREMRRNHHPTVKPTALMRYLCRLVTPPSGIVLDPFMGSGSTGKAAMLEGFEFIGIERDDAYFEIAKERIGKAMANVQLDNTL